ncbi:MAG: GTPase Era [Alphaproteobacteria bacterium]|nr:GTPase Era [Rhodospirillales bacterium]MCW9045885.1 GTPase Era [Alphaproteobacteria bacterium]
MTDQQTHCGYVALVGAPNAGKSTLLNQFVGAKVSIVSPKVQTTRARVLGIHIEDNAQMIFVDTPGIFAPKRRLDRAMVAAAWGGASDADTVVLLVDAKRGLCPDTVAIIEQFKKHKTKTILAINKVDISKKDKLLELTSKLDAFGIFTDIFMISALDGSGVSDLLAHLKGGLPEGPWLFPDDQISDMPERMMAAEITREKLYLNLHQELPYRATVETDSWAEKKDGSIRIEQTIFVERDSQKSIVLGKGGQQIKAIGAASRKELEEIMECRVHLFLFVKVRDSWGDDPERFKAMGLQFDA